MQGFIIYLNFDGNTRDAMTFYQQCLDAELTIQTFGDMKAPGMPKTPGSEDRVVHARLTKGSAVVMASDTMPGAKLVQGNNFLINIACESLAEIERLFAAFGAGGTVMMPLQDTFWGARFGMLTDKFGVQWMFNYDLPKNG
jgi:PhnB protein